MPRITIKELEKKFESINNRLAKKGSKRRLMLGQRYGRKYIDQYNFKPGGKEKWVLSGDPLTSGTASEINEFLRAILIGMTF